jgi:sarcosine oxidase subunit gamma
MLETRFSTGRVVPLGTVVKTISDPSGVEIRPVGAEARFSLRVRLSGEVGTEVAGFDLSAPLNTVAANGDQWIARLGPDEWLVGCPESDSDLVQARIGEGLGGRAYALVDVSHRNVGIDIAGEHAAIALNAGCPLDLGETAFPPGSATRTLLGKAEIVLLRAGTEPKYRVECWRSFADYVHTFLAEAVFGLGGPGAWPAR